MARHPPVRKRTRESQPSHSGSSASENAETSLETHIGKLEDQLGLLRAQVRQAQQLASLGTVAATIAHEVNNLLTPILSYAQSALREEDQALQHKALTVTVKNGRMLVAMTERVLDMSAARPSNRREVSVRAAAQNAVDSLCRDLAKDGIQLAMKVGESVTVWADPLQLQQVLFNLFLNARSAMASSHNGRLSIEAEGAGDEVVIQVKDTGKGIPGDILPYVFDPLQTSKPANGNGLQRCAGLGLTLCRDLTEENGGSIRVTSEPGKGTTFTIRLPATEPAKPQEAP
ncbi:MAG: sensor histidine kinase [Planctomycetota bacterium]|jgi:signal transduction histidine kinase